MRLVDTPTVRMLIGLALVVGLFGCSRKAEITPGARLIQSGDVEIWTVCDRGNRLYLTRKGLAQLVPMGCVDGQP